MRRMFLQSVHAPDLLGEHAASIDQADDLSAGLRSKGVERPQILSMGVTQDVKISAGSSNAKEGFAGRLPAIIHRFDFQRLLAERKAYRPLVCPISCMTFHTNLTHFAFLQWTIQMAMASALLCRAIYSALNAAPNKMMTTVKFIQSIRPIAVANPPYTRLYGTCLM